MRFHVPGLCHTLPTKEYSALRVLTEKTAVLSDDALART